MVEIVVHVDEALEETARAGLVNALENVEGIASAEFCPLRYHLMLVRYDRSRFNSQQVLGRVNGLNVHAKLIGPL
jgi:hypothetical protein